MPGSLDQYLQQFKKYVDMGRALGIGAQKVAPPPKPSLNPDEETAVEKIEQQIKTQTTPPVVVTFDVESFHKDVMSKVGPKYSEVNPCTIAYEASDLGFLTPAHSVEEVQGYADYLLSLYENAFAYVWGYGYQQALDEVGKPGCPKCPAEKATCGGFWSLEAKAHYMGMEFYVVLTQLQSVIRARARFMNYIEHGGNWEKIKAKFRGQPTLYQALYLAPSN